MSLVVAPASAAPTTAAPATVAATTATAAAPAARGAAAEPRHVLRGRALLPLHDVELHVLAFVQRLEAAALDGRVVNEQILAPVLGSDEAETLGVIEPLHFSLRAHRAGLHPKLEVLVRGRPRAGPLADRDDAASAPNGAASGGGAVSKSRSGPSGGRQRLLDGGTMPFMRM